MTRRILVDADLIERMLSEQAIFPLRPEDDAALRAALEAPEPEWGKILVDSITKAWRLGQLYWQQADSDFISQQKKSDATREKFIALREAALGALSALTSTASADPDDVAALRADAERYQWLKENMKLGIEWCGSGWLLRYRGTAPDNIHDLDATIDAARRNEGRA